LIWKRHQTLLDKDFEWNKRKDVEGSIYFISMRKSDIRLVDFTKNLPTLKKASKSPMGRYLLAGQEIDHAEEERFQEPLIPKKEAEQTRARCLRIESQAEKVDLNVEQMNAFFNGLQYPFSMVQGPPGTGKTTLLVQLVSSLLNHKHILGFARPKAKQLARQQLDGRILICTPSNAACDHLFGALLELPTVNKQAITRVYSRTIEAADGGRKPTARSSDSIASRRKTTVARILWTSCAQGTILCRTLFVLGLMLHRRHYDSVQSTMHTT